MSQCTKKSYKKASALKEYHVYKVIWIPKVAKKLLVNRENDDKNTIAVMKDGDFLVTYLTQFRVFHFSVIIAFGAVTVIIGAWILCYALAFIRITAVI